MLTALKSWNGKIEVNGKKYDSVEHAIFDFKAFSGAVNIKLYPVQENTLKNENRAVKTDDTKNEKQKYKITVKKYMTECASPSFDFMAKWNNNEPMQLRTMTGWIEKETAGMLYMHLTGQAEETCTCLRCNRELTNPVSKIYGIGPECMEKLGMVRFDIEDVEEITKKLKEVCWTGWVIKSAILNKEKI